ncbi:hypothetical protein OS175_12285 [Marinicella sp. S1101]|uniref:hypothetical protein n=1 Tax=Marinicella marina TaxID=2996016 RepID=UPI002260BED4|nr:hypothetical protein [Marinicella marina]MCX7554660.1 hypothetical protein [Marinicella marina]MDJ1140725.1 hypothetical protein [Marinicella marina]
MKFLLLLFAFSMASSLQAKKTKLYHCNQADGTTVIQDRKCAVTALQQKSQATRSERKKPLQRRPKPLQQPHQSVKPSMPNNIAQARSPYFSFGWARFIPANWSVYKRQSRDHEQTWWSRKVLNSPAEFQAGVSLKAYKDTMSNLRMGAFAQALLLYHQIRDNPGHRLLDSQFKSHDRFKVFNIKYQQPNNILTTTEYYIDDHNNDLFVITAQAPEAQWSVQWGLAEKIINQL